jgi:hypothetical protein
MTYEFIIHNDTYYVPRAPSLCEARVRNDAFKKQFDAEPMIVSPLEWELLSTKYTILILHESNV